MPHTGTDDIEIYYEVRGRDADPLVVLISGGGAQLLSWDERFMQLLVDEGFRVVRFDNRDTGLSHRFGDETVLDGGYGLEDMAGDVMRVLDDLGVEAAHLAGHSMGGMIAQMAALEHAERVLSLGLLSTIPGRDPAWVLHDVPVIEPPVRITREQQIAAGIEYARSDATGRFDPQLDWHAAKAAEAYDRGYAPEGGTRQWSALLRAPERLERLRGVTIPAFVFHGRGDRVLHWRSAVDIAEAIPDAELQVHPGMGHLIPFELWPELVAGIVRAARRA